MFDTWPRTPIPGYFTSDAWKECVSPGHDTIVGVPLSDGGDRTNQTWSTAADTAFDDSAGPGDGPGFVQEQAGGRGRNNVLWTAQWLSYIYQNGGGATPVVNDSIKSRVRLDLGTWKADCVVLADGTQNLAAVKNFLDQAIAPGKLEGDVIVWQEPDRLRSGGGRRQVPAVGGRRQVLAVGGRRVGAGGTRQPKAPLWKISGVDSPSASSPRTRPITIMWSPPG